MCLVACTCLLVCMHLDGARVMDVGRVVRYGMYNMIYLTWTHLDLLRLGHVYASPSLYMCARACLLLASTSIINPLAKTNSPRKAIEIFHHSFISHYLNLKIHMHHTTQSYTEVISGFSSIRIYSPQSKSNSSSYQIPPRHTYLQPSIYYTSKLTYRRKPADLKTMHHIPSISSHPIHPSKNKNKHFNQACPEGSLASGFQRDV